MRKQLFVIGLGMALAAAGALASTTSETWRKHVVSSAQAQALVDNAAGSTSLASTSPKEAQVLSAATASGTPVSYTWPAEAVKYLLAQPGVVNIKIQEAREPDGTPTIVMWGIKTDGSTVPVALNDVMPCPPFCGNDPGNPPRP